MKKRRKRYSSEEKVSIIRKHLIDGVPISDLCDELGLQPTVFYRWQKQFFENGAKAFEVSGSHQVKASDRQISQLEEKLRIKNEVLSELMEEHVLFKKSLGLL